MKNCYIKLDELYSKVKRAEDEKKVNLLQEYESEYSSIIQNVENHTDEDYLYFRYSLRDNEDTTLPEFKNSDSLQYWLLKSWFVLKSFLYFILPIAVAYFWNMFTNVSIK